LSLSSFGATRRRCVVAGAYSSSLGCVQGLPPGPGRFRWGLSSLGPTGGYCCRWVSFSLGLVVVGLSYSLSLGPTGGYRFRWVSLFPGRVLFDTLERGIGMVSGWKESEA
jgi:hypothetical protein